MGRSDDRHDRGSSRHGRDRSVERHRSSRRSYSPDDRYSRRSDHRSRSRSRSRSPSRHRREKRRRSPSVSSSSDSYSSESEHERRRKRHKKSKKEMKDRKHKSKKSKKKKKKSKELKVGDEWGKYGIINESDIFTKEPEFHAWLLEVKNINPVQVNKTRSRELFIDFMDDYNTATMPHEKYYNMAKWEARQHAIRMGEAPPSSDYGSYNFARDEEQLRMQHRQTARAAASAKQTPVSLSKDQLEELTKVNRERVQADRMRRMGLTPKEGMGVRYEYEAD